MTNEKTTDSAASALSAGLERKPLGLAEFIELCGGFELTPYQREMVAAIERGERLMLDPATMREPYRQWKRRHEEYFVAFMRSNVQADRREPQSGEASSPNGDGRAAG